MNIRETIQALEAKDVVIALDVGEHSYCDIYSNCPIAIQLRKLVVDSGVGLAGIMEGYQEVTAEPLVTVDTRSIDAKAHIRVLNKDIELDLKDLVSEEIMISLQAKLSNISDQHKRLITLGKSYHSTYLTEIAKLRTNKTLTQFQASIADLLRYKAYITEEAGKYSFIFQIVYRPEYIVDNGVRFAINPLDIAGIRREGYLKVNVTSDGQVYSVTIMDVNMEKLSHYHGRGNDCWGTIRWGLDGRMTLQAIHRIKTIAMGSLATINFNSLMNHTPPGMPRIEDLLARSTRLGKEGELSTPEEVMVGSDGRPLEERGTWGTQATTAPPPRWGERR